MECNLLLSRREGQSSVPLPNQANPLDAEAQLGRFPAFATAPVIGERYALGNRKGLT